MLRIQQKIICHAKKQENHLSENRAQTDVNAQMNPAL